MRIKPGGTPNRNRPARSLDLGPATALLLLLLVACAVSWARPALAGGTVTGDTVKWHPVTVSFTGPTAAETDDSPNPFLDYRLEVVFTGPGGQTYRVPGFFDGDGGGGGTGNIWRVRFAPDEAGTWAYVASFRQGSDIAIDLDPGAGSAASFDGSTGSINVAALDPNAPGFLKWGRLDHANGHYLKFRDGPYWIKGGVDSPENFLGYEGFDNTVKQGGKGVLHEFAPHVGDWRTGDPDFISEDTGIDGRGIIGALNYLAQQDINSIYFLPMNLGGDAQDTYPFVGPAKSAFDKTHYDISKLSQWATVLDHAQSLGIALNIVLAETEAANEAWLDGGALGLERKLFFREMIARFGHLLAIKWNLSEENDYSDDTLRAFADQIEALDWAGHQITFHTHPNGLRQYAPHLGSSRFDATSVQYSPDRAGQQVESLRSDSTKSGRPLVVDMDENNPASTGLSDTNAADLRKRVLYDVYFGGGSIEWYFGAHSLPLGGDQSVEDFATREAMYDHTRVARRFMEDHLPFWDMAPADELLAGESSAFGGGEVFQKAGDVYAVYLPDANPSGTLTLPDGSYTKSWFNPRSGLFEGTATAVAGGFVDLGSPPSNPDDDWVLLLKSTGNLSPEVVFTAPTAGRNVPVGADLAVTAEASDPDGTISRVELYMDGILVAANSTAPYAWSDEILLRDLSSGVHVLELLAFDDDGAESGARLAVTASDPSATEPIVGFLSPLDGEVLPEGASPEAIVMGVDLDGSLAYVELFLDGVFLRRESVAPFLWSADKDAKLANMTQGSYTLTAVAQDLQGATSTASIAFTIGQGGTDTNRPPQVLIVDPLNGDVVPENTPVDVAVEASDPDGAVTGVALYLDGVLVREDTVAPYQWGATTDPALSGLVAGSHILKAVATDDQGATAETTVTIAVESATRTNLPPLASFSQPLDGQTVAEGTSLDVIVAASDPDGSVANVKLFLDGTFLRQENISPYEWPASKDKALSNLAPGSHVLKAVATDNEGATTTIAITVTLGETIPVNLPPQVDFDRPLDGQVFAEGSGIDVAAAAADPDGSIAKVTMFLDGIAVREDSEAPYQWTSTTDAALANLAPGTYTLKAIATDDQGATDEASISISVETATTGNLPPQVSFGQPLDGQVFAKGDNLDVVVAAADPDGSVANVRLFLNGIFVRQENVSPYEWPAAKDVALSDLAPGDHVLKAVATDDQGATTEVSLTVTVSGNNEPPLVGFARPVDGQTIPSGTGLSVVVDASDSDGAIANVRLFLNGQFVRQENFSPYEWSASKDAALAKLAPGSHVLKAVATDNQGASRDIAITILAE